MKAAKTIVRIVCVCFGAALIADAVFMARVANFNIGVIFALCMGLVLSVLGVFFPFWESVTKHGFLRAVKYIFCIGMACLAGLIAFTALFGTLDNTDYTEDAVVVLGAGIQGERVTRTLKYRLDTAVTYHKQNPDAYILVTGGQGPQERITEALAMERYLLNQGVSPDKILKEERATSTYENFQFAKPILDNALGGASYRIAFITNGFHIYRGSVYAKLAGFSATHLAAESEWYTLPLDYLRESAAILKLWVVGK